MRLLLTLGLAAACAAYLSAEPRVTLADRGLALGIATSAPVTSAALIRTGGTVGAMPRAATQDAAQPDSASLQAASGGDSVTLADAPAVTSTASPPDTVTAVPSVSATVLVMHDGKADRISSTVSTVADLLGQMGLQIGALDKVSPALTASLATVALVRIVRVTQSTLRQSIDVPFRHLVKNSSSVELGVEQTSQTGANGLTQKIFRQTFQDGNLVSTVLAATQVVRNPRDEIKLIGTHQPSCSCRAGSQAGMASWYGIGGLSAASPSLPFGTVVRVTNSATGRSVNVVIRDRGPYAGADRVIDLSPTAFAQIGALGSGIISVSLRW